MTVRAGTLGQAGAASSAPVAAPRPLAGVALTPDAREPGGWRLAQLNPGRPYPAQLLSRFDDGSFLIKIGAAAIRAQLPAGAKTGDTLTLTLLTPAPRLTFLLGAPEVHDTPVLSPAARLIAGLLRQEEAAPTALAGRAPLLPEPAATDPGRLAQSLREALDFSGLFYEAHLRQWAEGERSLEQLRREPQAAAGASRALAAEDGLPALPGPESAQLLRLQLDTLEQQRVLWRGELWPGQPLEWSVEQEGGAAREPARPEEERAWHSVLRLELPQLGPVAASLRLCDGRLQISVQAASAAAVSALRARGGGLAAALEAAGAPLELLTVRHGE